MKLSDVMSAANLAAYAEVALLIFFLVFVAVIVYVLRGRKEWQRARYLPLDSGNGAPHSEVDDDTAS
jgi:cbb3-type cytochrome oxidase subunit 3